MKSYRPAREWLCDVMTGAVSLDDVPALSRPLVLSMSILPVHQAACRVLSWPARDERRLALSKIPASIRPQVEAEVLRLHALRRG